MPRLEEPDELSLAIGQRIKQLREEAGLTMEQLAYGSEMGSKGHLSNMEKGLVRPTVQTLQALADHLGVLLVDILCRPEATEREALLEASRGASKAKIKAAMGKLE